ncbi:hypothetical protein LOTGIDRAFT_170193 [Lottia gigantea]|uniref:Sushi domain-containing protein n=1 Tax=Lottia gigantea TaxID=225164 RepID=V4B1W9_LOTGI|nr:hypothetical protein LOTGIDRAFT_170193 [Lottia gigantea]ESO82274.1 hypothetical protein LOTGIDRAFT_170193 [Lottia gigantea]
MALRLVLLVASTLLVSSQSLTWWSPAVCRNTPSLNNGNIIRNGWNNFDYKCNTGYELSVTGNCRSRLWRPQVTCKVVECEGDQMITNSDDKTIKGTFGDPFSFNCKAGFTELGPTGSLTCGDQGQWQIDAGCEAVECPEGEVIGRPNSTDTTIAGTFGDPFVFTCLPGFTRDGTTGSMICGTDGSKGIWQIIRPCIGNVIF